MEEFEIKFLEVDVPELEKKLLAIGAKKVGEYFFRRRHFDYPDLHLDKKGEWIRVRDEGEKITMAHKKISNFDQNKKDRRDVIIEEQEIVVSDFDAACKILFAAGLMEKNYIESKRIRYVKDGIEYDIDIFPKLPPYLEIEGKSIESVREAASELGFDLEKAVRYTAAQMYKDRGMNLHDYQIVTFEKFVKKTDA